MTLSKTIEGLHITSAPLDAWAGYSLLPEIVRIVAPLVSAKGGEIDLEKALRNAATSLEGDRLPELLTRLLANTVIVAPGPNGSQKFEITNKATFSLAFSGPRFWAAIKVAMFAFEVTYGNFTDVIARFVAAAPTE